MFRHLGALCQAEVMMVMDGAGTDGARRFFKGRKCVFIMVSEFKRHDPKVAAIWPDILLNFLPVTLRIDIGKHSIHLLRRYSGRLTYRALGVLVKFVQRISKSETPALPIPGFLS